MRVVVMLFALCAGPLDLAGQQSLNIDLLGRLDPYTRYSDIWGYAAPTGKEYALLASAGGTSVIDCTNPAVPVERGFFPGPVSDLRDIKTYSTFAYVVNERGGGVQILDLSDPDNPSLVGTWGAAWFTHAHNVAIDPGTGWIYAVGTDVGTVVLDASANPRAPALVGIYGSAYVQDYVHDLAVQNGRGHAAMVWNGEYRVIDVTTWPFQTLSDTRTAAAFTHNCWPRGDDAIVVTTDEQEGGLVQFWDLTDPTAPVALAVFSPNTVAIPHNAFLQGELCHVAWFTEGYRLLDVSDPTRPAELGYYDTYAGPSGTSDGAFGCYPFQPSGHVYVSDRSDGLFVLRPHRLRIEHDARGDVADEDGPYPVIATVTSPDAITAVDLWWAAGGGAFTRVPMQPTGNPDEFAAAIPGQRAPMAVAYYLTAADSAGGNTRHPIPPGDLGFDVGSRITVFADDFETPGGWTHGASRGIDDWQRGAPAGVGGTSRVAWLDADRAHSGAFAWGNDLGLAGADGAYPDRTTSWLQSAAIPTGGVQGLRLTLWRWLNIEDAVADRARVLVNGQVVWQNPTGRHLQDFHWNEMEIDVAAITDAAATATIRFELIAGAGVELGGWNLDDVSLCALGDCVPPRRYGAGTPGTGGATPTIDLVGAARVGDPFQIDGAAMLGGTAAALLLGVQPASLPAIGVTVLVDLAGAVVVPVSVTGAGAGAGRTALSFAVPDDPSLDDVDLFTQWIVADPGSPGGWLASSAGLRVRVCVQ